MGCLVANIIGGGMIWDIIFGSIATLIGAVGTYLVRKNKWLAPIPPIVSNTIIVPFVLKYAYGYDGLLTYFMFSVCLSEIIVCGIIRMALLILLSRYRHNIFRN